MKFVEALKIFNTGKKYSIPKKGTPEYDEVMKIMNKDKPAADAAAAPAKPKRTRKPKAMEPAKEPEKAMEPAKEPEKAVAAAAPVKAARKPRVKRVSLETQDAVDTRAVEPRKRKAKLPVGAGSVPVGMIPEGLTKKAAIASKNPEAVFQNAVNAFIPIVDPAVAAGLASVKKTKKQLREVMAPSIPVLVNKETIVNEKPFSFQELRNKLGC